MFYKRGKTVFFLGLCLTFGCAVGANGGCGDDSPNENNSCEPQTARCEGDSVVVCQADGTGWTEPRPCAQDETCLNGFCVPAVCEPGEAFCAGNSLLICGDDGVSWQEEPCPEGWVCFFESCRQCVEDEGCGETEWCNDGVCEPLPAEITTTEIPDGMIDQHYTHALESNCEEGSWSLIDGTLPAGMDMGVDGLIAGTPDATGNHAFGVRLDCGVKGTDDASYVLRIHAEGLTVATDTLPDGLQGFSYEAELNALGGNPPYGWMVSDGTLPQGLILSYDGLIFGNPEEVGQFPLTVKVFDDADPPQMASQDLVLTIDIAPLEIVGEQEYDLLMEKVIVLDTIIVVPSIPIPYSTQLEAKGGLQPYHWAETALPAGLEWIIAQSGIPEGLTLDDDGTLHGSVTSTEQVITVAIPFTQIELTGFFFAAEVTDSQSPAETDSAVFVIPTTPVGQ